MNGEERNPNLSAAPVGAAVKIFLNPNLSAAASLLLPVAEMDEEEEVADIREQIFHNTVREHIVSAVFIIGFS